MFGREKHAIPAADHDPRASGWVAMCGTLCIGPNYRTAERAGKTFCPRCIDHLIQPSKLNDTSEKAELADGPVVATAATQADKSLASSR